MRGFYCLDKPSGMTSSDAVVKVRGILRAATGTRFKVGHLGTLDPLATGVLPIAVGTATRLFDYFSGREKEYTATFKFGVQTDTLDSSGIIQSEGGRIPSIDEVITATNLQIGEINQLPPVYSAKSVGGVRSYELARKGKAVQPPSKTVHIYDIKVKKSPLDDCFQMKIRCGSGTYVRAIGRDVAATLGTYATMTALRRNFVADGLFSESICLGFEDIEKDVNRGFLSIDEVLKNEPCVELPQELLSKALNGVPVNVGSLPDGDFLVKAPVNAAFQSLDEKREDDVTYKNNISIFDTSNKNVSNCGISINNVSSSATQSIIAIGGATADGYLRLKTRL